MQAARRPTLGARMKYRLCCISCSREFPADPLASTCPDCGPFKGTLDVRYQIAKTGLSLKSLSQSLGRVSIYKLFADIFPFEKTSSLPPLAVGGTPLIRCANLNDYLQTPGLSIKDDSRNPSASFKDRASAVALAMARECGAETIAVASTGNAASSLAALAAATAIKAVVFVPETIPRPKLIQIMFHGAKVVRLNCNYDRTFDLCGEFTRKHGWYNRNTAVNPFTGEGKKSAALEIALQLGEPPETVVCPVGDGCIISGLHKGFSDLAEMGLIAAVPRLYGIQAENSAPLAAAFDSGGDIQPLADPVTAADSIRVGYPRDGLKALRAARTTKGAIIRVADREILEAQKLLARKAGIWAEPAAAASLAGYLRLCERGMIDRREKTVILITGHGLKDVESAAKSLIETPILIQPNIEAIEKYLETVIDP